MFACSFLFYLRRLPNETKSMYDSSRENGKQLFAARLFLLLLFRVWVYCQQKKMIDFGLCFWEAQQNQEKSLERILLFCWGGQGPKCVVELYLFCVKRIVGGKTLFCYLSETFPFSYILVSCIVLCALYSEVRCTLPPPAHTRTNKQTNNQTTVQQFAKKKIQISSSIYVSIEPDQSSNPTPPSYPRGLYIK